MENLVKMTIVSRSEVKKATDGRSYFTALISPGFGLKLTSRNFWQQFKRDKSGLPTSELQWERVSPKQADAFIESGESFLASKVTETVEPYMIGEGENARQVDTYSQIVFADENIEAIFASANHPILDKETGELKGKKVAKLATKPAEEVSAEVKA